MEPSQNQPNAACPAGGNQPASFPAGDNPAAADQVASADDGGQDLPPEKRQATLGPDAVKKDDGQYSAFKVWQKRLIVSLAASVGWFSTSSSFIFFPVIPFLARDLHESTERINLTVTSYLVASGVFPSIVCGLSDVYGRRPVLITAVGSYVLVNVGLAVQRSFGVMLGLRLLQSAAISGTYINLATNFPFLFLCKTIRVLIRSFTIATFSFAYGVLGDVTTSTERGEYISLMSIL